MPTTLFATRLANGVTLSVIDRSRRYFGDYHQVRLEVTATIDMTAPVISAEQRSQLGRSTIDYARVVEQMAVPSAELATVKQRLLENFRQHTLPYLAQPDFPARLVAAEIGKRRRR